MKVYGFLFFLFLMCVQSIFVSGYQGISPSSVVLNTTREEALFRVYTDIPVSIEVNDSLLSVNASRLDPGVHDLLVRVVEQKKGDVSLNLVPLLKETKAVELGVGGVVHMDYAERLPSGKLEARWVWSGILGVAVLVGLSLAVLMR